MKDFRIINNIKNYLIQALSLDLRALAIYRIIIALVIIVDILHRFFDLTAHYSDYGLLSRAALFDLRYVINSFSFYFASGAVAFQAFLFVITIIVACFLLFGLKTRTVSVLIWLLILSLHNRNPAILNAGDSLLRMLVFWSMFLPLGSKYSLDCYLNQNSDNVRRKSYVLNAASVAFIFQIIVLYVFTAILKTDPAWWRDGTAIYQALSVDQLTSAFGLIFVKLSWILPSLTIAVYNLELYGCLFLFIPFYTAYFRIFICFIFILFHTGIILTMTVGTFPFIDIASLIALLPRVFWDFIEHNVYFYCLKFPNISRFRIKFWNLIYFFQDKFPNVFRANKPYFRLNILLQISIIALCFYFMGLCVNSVGHWRKGDPAQNNLVKNELLKIPRCFPSWAWNIESVLMSYQTWNMFAPKPLSDDGWYVISGRLADGSEVDLFQNWGGIVSYKKPECVSCTYSNQRWQKYMMNLKNDSFKKYRLYYGKYLCSKWNFGVEQTKRLQFIEINYMRERTLPNYKTAPVQKIMLWQHSCAVYFSSTAKAEPGNPVQASLIPKTN